jgi:alanine racemase
MELMTVTKIVHLDRYQENLKQIIETMSPVKVMAVVKADGYGHGLIETARAATESGIELLGVLDIESAIHLRKSGISKPCFAWLHSPQSDFAAAIRAGVELSASSIEELENIASAPGRAKIHLKLDTGLSRNGCRIENWTALVARALTLESENTVVVEAMWSHLSGTSMADDEAALSVFDEGFEIATKLGFVGYRHIASSPSAFSNARSRFDMVRIGVSAFGTSPVAGQAASAFGLQPAMTVTAEVLSPGVISMGFLHGLFSSLAGKLSVKIEGKPYSVLEIGPLASRIELGEYEVGDLVQIFGDDAVVSAEQLCELIDTVTDELFTGLKANLTTYTS